MYISSLQSANKNTNFCDLSNKIEQLKKNYVKKNEKKTKNHLEKK